ncbi:VOC family protein [Hansschlegelia quercus]|uniref:VOC family protein n=1 Tax=Hansschlegelia quercus TaxID=2528245 RepID=A0A4Q9GGL4_9HYPH|nr:VOC family protein [Hansschlegelia quercus]TBN53259.1 VOC family protein [Hansschlegelia quercus]
MTPPLTLSLVTLGVADVARATAFYEALGLTRAAASSDAVSFFNTGGPVLALYGRDALAEDARVSAAGSGFPGVTLAWNLGSPAEVDEAMIRCAAAGGALVKPACKAFWGGYSGYIADLDGHLWEIAHNPGFPVDAAGRLRAPEKPEG